jgi:hypothetical protein
MALPSKPMLVLLEFLPRGAVRPDPHRSSNGMRSYHYRPQSYFWSAKTHLLEDATRGEYS